MKMSITTIYHERQTTNREYTAEDPHWQNDELPRNTNGKLRTFAVSLTRVLLGNVRIEEELRSRARVRMT